ncbi:hypothetical protein [Sphingobacterium zeae]|uniref:Uncharacterized protein n=1 Tax=Sphingobacterium zeae TaxID=1776859 RepID=A0ABU0U316_9SPHI|nr:hypothetical protein [Sphingobacterium zeae]MDQ1149357.1 hypothetical protein [Sphingobacterium zeae]
MRKHLLLLRFLITQLLPTFLSAQSASVNLGLKEVMRRYKAIGLSVVVYSYHKSLQYSGK